MSLNIIATMVIQLQPNFQTEKKNIMLSPKQDGKGKTKLHLIINHNNLLVLENVTMVQA